MTYQRKCKNWLQDFSRWTLPRCESPETFVFWTGMFTLSAAVRRHVVFPRKYFGSWSASPNLYVIFVAPPGKARKSTTTGFAEDLLDGLTDITKAPTIVTQASLLSRLVTSSDASVYILSSEFGSFIQKSGVEMFEFLTDIFDGRKNIEASTVSRGVEFAEKPCVNLIAATTPRWIAENMPESVIGGGFASRVVFVFEDKVRRRQLYYNELDYSYLDKLKDNLIADLQHISELHGDFELTDEAKIFMEGWYRDNADNMPTENYRLFGYYERKPAHIHKVAMLLSLAEKDELLITKKNFEDAITVLEQLEIKLPKAFQVIGKNTHAPDMDNILEYVQEKGSVRRDILLREFYSAANPNLLEELLLGLQQMQVIQQVIGEDKKIYYKAIGTSPASSYTQQSSD